MTAPCTTVELNVLMDQFMGERQRRAIASALRGEEKAYFRDKLIELATRIQAMPVTYQNEWDLGPKDPTVHLHYFVGNADWFIIEKDVNQDGEGQIQAFGLADLFRDGGELGYISLPEILAAHAELDFYFEPRPLSLVRAGRK